MKRAVRVRGVMMGATLAGIVASNALFHAVAPDAGELPENGDFDAGIVAFLEGDLATAATQWRPLAEGGDVLAQFNLGSLYLITDRVSAGPSGPGFDAVNSDVVEAAWWLAKAARQGHARAQYALAKIYRDGTGDDATVATVPLDDGAALDWLAAAAMQGHGPAQVDLGLAYMGRGAGVLAPLRRDNTVAWQWLSLARDQGEREAIAALADLAPLLTAAERAVAEAAAATLVSRQSSGREAETKF